MTAVRPLTPEKEAEINELVAGRVAEITIQGEPGTVVTKDVRLDGNSVRLRASDPASPQGEAWLPETEKPLASVRQIEVRDHGRGFFYGLAIGASFGTVVGAIDAEAYTQARLGVTLSLPLTAAGSTPRRPRPRPRSSA
jgi:hypothetical protein